jgi:hypothetical protein
MKKIIVTVISMCILLSAPLAMARGNTVRATLNQMWDKEQARQERMDKDLSSIQKDTRGAAKGTPSNPGTPYAPKRTGNR